MPDYEIELTDGRKFVVTADAPPSEADVLAALGGQSAAPQAAAEPPVGGLLPTAGSFVGSLVGTLGGLPGRVVGAAAGGALGKGAELFFDEKDDSVADSLRQMGGSAMEQGGLELAGGALGKVVKGFAPRLYQSVLKPSKAVRQEFGDVAQTAVERAVPISKGGERKVGTLIASTAQKTKDRLAVAQRMGAKPIDMRDVVPELQTVARKVAQEPLDAGTKLQDIADIGSRLAQQHPSPIPIVEAQGMKQAAQRVAGEGYRKVARGADINTVPLDANMAIARGLRKQIEQRVPSVGPLNQQTQSLMGLERSLDDALGRISNNHPSGLGMSALIASGAGAGAYGASGDAGLGGGVGLGILALTNPYLASRAAIGLHKASPAIGQAPNLLRAALLAELAGEQ